MSLTKTNAAWEIAFSKCCWIIRSSSVPFNDPNERYLSNTDTGDSEVVGSFSGIVHESANEPVVMY
jgi:hypothetical protein